MDHPRSRSLRRLNPRSEMSRTISSVLLDSSMSPMLTPPPHSTRRSSTSAARVRFHSSLISYEQLTPSFPRLDYTVQIDTGSSDLWVYSQDTLPKMSPSMSFANISYLDGSSGEVFSFSFPRAFRSNSMACIASGPIAFAEFSMGSYSVPSQGVFLRFLVSNCPYLSPGPAQHSSTRRT